MDYITRTEFREVFQQLYDLIDRNWKTYNEELYEVVKDTDYAKEWLPRIQKRLDDLENRVDYFENKN